MIRFLFSFSFDELDVTNGIQVCVKIGNSPIFINNLTTIIGHYGDHKSRW